MCLNGNMSKLKYHKILNIQRLFRDGVSGNGREVFQYFDTSLGGLFLFGGNVKRKKIPIKTQMAVIARDEHKCQYCGKEARWTIANRGVVTRLFEKEPIYPLRRFSWSGNEDPVPFEIDHVIPIREGGTNNIENLKLSCRYCNRSKQ